MIDLQSFLLALHVVTLFQVKVEMIIGSMLGGGVMIFYYLNKYKSGNWSSSDGKNIGYVFLGVTMFIVAMVVI